MSTDCLVLKLEEVEVDTNILDTTMYIIYDKKRHNFLVRGKRRNTSNIRSCPYSFECELAHELADFIQYTICPENKVNEILYNYDNLPEDPHDISFELLRGYDDMAYEVSGYNDRRLKRGRLLKILRMLRNVSNEY